MRRPLGSRLGNALVRIRRDQRFALVDRYRALLASRYVAVTAVAVALVDRAAGLRGATACRRRPSSPAGPRLIRAVLGTDDVLSLIVAGAPAGALVLRDVDRTLDLSAISDAGLGTTRYVATLPDDAADGTDWTVSIGATDLVVTEPADVPRGLTAKNDRLVLSGRIAAAPGVEHTVEVGVATILVRWPAAAGHRLQIGNSHVDARLVGEHCVAEVDLAAIDLGPASVDGAPLVLRRGRWASDVRPVTPPPIRIHTPRTGVEIGYTADGQLEFRAVEAIVAVWT